MSGIDPRIHQALDDERGREGLPPELQAEIARLETAAALLREAAAPPATLAARVMAEVRAPRPGPLARAARWVTGRHAVTIGLRPLWSLGVAAAAVIVALGAPLLAPAGSGGRGTILKAEEGIAQFVARFPGARSVEVVGSFTDWRPGKIALRDDDHDGVWQANVVLPAGTHQYMFVVDGERWVSDPLAGRYVDDGFGQQNALIIVRPAMEEP